MLYALGIFRPISFFFLVGFTNNNGMFHLDQRRSGDEANSQPQNRKAHDLHGIRDGVEGQCIGSRSLRAGPHQLVVMEETRPVYTGNLSPLLLVSFFFFFWFVYFIRLNNLLIYFQSYIFPAKI